MKAFTPYRPIRRLYGGAPGANKNWLSRSWGRIFGIQRIGKHWDSKPDVITYDDGREICNPATEGGRFEYNLRIWLMWVRQDGLCCNCRRPLRMKEATFEHENHRTKAQQDDRIVIHDAEGRFVKNLNGASHFLCNFYRGSRHTPIWHGANCIIESEAL